jgi:anti-sigma B factor antagonist
MQAFQLESIPAGADCAVLRVAGEVDAYTAPQLRERVIRLLADGEVHIVVDMREVEFLDSTGLGALVGSLKRARMQDGSLKLIMGSGRILHIFRLTDLSKAFAIHPSVAEAINDDQHWQAALAHDGVDASDWCREHGL